METFKLIIAGGRDFADYDLLTRVMYSLADDTDFDDKEIEIVSGMARGADALGYMFAHKHDLKVHEFPAHWQRYGAKAGYMRNSEMSKFADGLLAFWDKSSKGTNHMIDQMLRLKKPVHIVEYSINK